MSPHFPHLVAGAATSFGALGSSYANTSTWSPAPTLTLSVPKIATRVAHRAYTAAMRLVGMAFLAASVTLGVLVHFITRQEMAWWPDTAIIGASLGGLATLIVFKAVRVDLPLNRALFRGIRAAVGAFKPR